MFIVMIRTIILYVLVFFVMRMMGKRQIGQLQPYELAVAIMISALAAIPMEDISIPLINSMVPILLLMIMQVLVSLASLKFRGARAYLCGKPSIVINNGKIEEAELRNLRVNLNDLLEQLRLGGYPNIADVEFGIMETNGQLSIVPKSQKRPLQPEDLKVPTPYEGLCQTLVVDGQIDYENLEQVGLSEGWLRQELAKFGITRIKDVLLASLDTQGRLYYQKKEPLQR